MTLHNRTSRNTPSSYEYNVEATAKVAELAHTCGVSVEGELGCLGSLEFGMANEEDGHGACKFTQKPPARCSALSA